ncbi:MAG: Wzz/FepE/Etk N-terminal domain-containing protein [Anaerocolumna sp.]
MEIRNNNMNEIDIKEIVHILVKKLWIIVIAAIIASAAIGCINLFVITPVYTSTTKIYVINRQDETKTTYSDLQTGTQITQDYMILVTSRPVLEQVISNINVNMTPDELNAMISIINPEGTRILEISVTDYDPLLAKKLADAIADVSARQLVNIMEIEKVNVAEYGNLPGEADSNNLARSFMMGALLGILISSAVIIVVHTVNDNIRTAEDIERHLGITTLGMIPLVDESNRRKRRLKKLNRKMNLAS